MSNVNVTRNWVNLNGYAMDPKLHYSAIFLNSSTTNALLLLVSLDYEFSKAFTLAAGYSKLPVAREWNDTFRYTLGPDRTMATTFFRPNYSPGIWASGVPIDGLHYVLMIANSFDGLNIAGNRLGTTPAFGGTVWYEGRGAFGPGISDIEDHQVITPRVGLGFAASREKLQSGSDISSNPEDTIFRLSDGTPLAQNGALGAGSHVDAVNVELLTLDAAMKYRGFSIAGEYFLRWLNSFSTSGAPITVKSLFDTGAYVQASYFILPKSLEAYTRCSFVHGQYGNGSEWGGGFNWYIDKTRNWRLTSEILRVNNSPAENVLTGYRAGASGTLFQTQMLIDF